MSNLLISILAVVFAAAGMSSPLQSTSFISTPNGMTSKVQNSNVINFIRNANSHSIGENEKSRDSIDEEETGISANVCIKDERVLTEEVVPTNLIEGTNPEVNLFSEDNFQESEFTHEKGYIKFITKVSTLGYYDGNIVYHIEVTTEQQKSFYINKYDDLFLQYDENSMPFICDDYTFKAERATPCEVCYSYDPKPIAFDEKEKLEPIWGDGKAYFEFKTGGKSVTNPQASVYYGGTTVTADFYILATGITAIRPVYVHNRSIFFNSIFRSFSGFRFGMNVGIRGDVMRGEGMTLGGYIY